MPTRDELTTTYQQLRDELLAERTAQGYWEGELATSAVSTATAVSALSLATRAAIDSGTFVAEIPAWTSLATRGAEWLAEHQNRDGGFGDTDRSYSNIATTYLVTAALSLAPGQQPFRAVIDRAESYIAQHGELAGLRRRYGTDKTFVVPIMTNLALAGRASFREIPALPFELACVPQSWYRLMKMPVVSYAIPALVAIGQAHYFLAPPWNPITRIVRSMSIERSLRVLLSMQPESGGYLEATPLTSFVVMSLAATGRLSHPVTQSGLRFIKDSVRPDGSWPIDTNLATWNTTLATLALAARGDERDLASIVSPELVRWILSCQHLVRHPFTGAEPGGFGWTNLSGAVPDADDTPGALLALAAVRDLPSLATLASEIDRSAELAVRWLLKLQNRDGGWPTFCKGWGQLPFDRSGNDLTAHAIRALEAWKDRLAAAGKISASDLRTIDTSLARGWRYLEQHQSADGSFLPLWFGNQDRADEDNPVYGTAKVLAACRDTNRWKCPLARRATAWMLTQQNADGSFGSSLEETSLAAEVLHQEALESTAAAQGLERALAWMVAQVASGKHRRAEPIGFYFAKLWYYERLYPVTFSLSTVGRVLRTLAP